MSNSKASKVASKASTSAGLDHSETERAKFFQRWPKLRELYICFERNEQVIDYRAETKIKEKLGNLIESELKKAWDDVDIKKSFRKSLTSTLSKKISKAEEKDPITRIPYLIFDELMSYYMDNKRKPSMVIKYYAQRAFQELRQTQLRWDYPPGGRYCPPSSQDKFEKVDNCSDDMIQGLESEMEFLSMFFHQEQLTMEYFIDSELNRLAERVLDLLREKNADHPLLSVTKDTLKEWQSKGFTVNKFDDAATREILDCQCELFKELGFEVDDRCEKDLIDIYEVLESKKGNWQVIFTIFMGVAHRLGVYCRLLRQQGNRKQPNLGWKSRISNSTETVDESGKANKRNYFALNIFECSEPQHQEVSCSEDYIEEVFGCTVAFEIIPDVVFGETRADLIDILDDQDMISHKYRLDSSDEDERYHDQRNRYNNWNDDSDDNERNSSDEDYSGGRKKKTDTIVISKKKFNKKLAAIRKRTKTFEARQEARNPGQETKKPKRKSEASTGKKSTKKSRKE